MPSCRTINLLCQRSLTMGIILTLMLVLAKLQADRYTGASPTTMKQPDTYSNPGMVPNYNGSPVTKPGQKASSSKDPGEVRTSNKMNPKKGNYSGQPSQKHSVINDAGNKALKHEVENKYGNSQGSPKQGVYENARKHANTAPTNNSKAGLKNGGQFQSNAMMMMSPFPVGAGGQPVGMVPQMPMYQPIAVQTGAGIQLMHPGFYPHMQMGMQPMGYPMMGMQGYSKQGSDPIAPAPYNYMSNQYIVGSKSANNYFPNDQRDGHQRHGLTEQGNFNVNRTYLERFRRIYTDQVSWRLRK